MDLLSIFKRKTASAASAAPVNRVQLARTRARRRLTGAAVLVVIGMVAFPLLFETQQRQIRVDVPIEIPRKDNAPPLVMPAPRHAAPVASAEQPVAQDEASTERDANIGSETALPADPADVATDKAKSKAAAGTATAFDEAVRARALLEGRPVGTASADAIVGAQFVVQVGAFSDAAAAREARLKLQALGLKTYIQNADTASGKLIRVRAGPYKTQEEANKVAAMVKVKDTALSVVVLPL